MSMRPEALVVVVLTYLLSARLELKRRPLRHPWTRHARHHQENIFATWLSDAGLLLYRYWGHNITSMSDTATPWDRRRWSDIFTRPWILTPMTNNPMHTCTTGTLTAWPQWERGHGHRQELPDNVCAMAKSVDLDDDLIETFFKGGIGKR